MVPLITDHNNFLARLSLVPSRSAPPIFPSFPPSHIFACVCIYGGRPGNEARLEESMTVYYRLTHCAPRMKKKKKSTHGKYMACRERPQMNAYSGSLTQGTREGGREGERGRERGREGESPKIPSLVLRTRTGRWYPC